MFYVPTTNSYLGLPATYVPVYSTSTSQTSAENTASQLNNDFVRVKSELAELRQELNDLRFEKQNCSICHSSLPPVKPVECHVVCSICSPPVSSEKPTDYSETCPICYRQSISEQINEVHHSPILSPVHFCSICDAYVIDEAVPPPSPSLHKKRPKSKNDSKEIDRLSEYLSRQLDLQRLDHRYIPEQRPVWIPTAYKNDYPHRRWVTRHCHFSEP